MMRVSLAEAAAPAESGRRASVAIGMDMGWLLLLGFSFSVTVVAQLVRKASSPKAAKGKRKCGFMEFKNE
ncbi:hypothetical protein GCM10027272_07110 [Hymenobacter frigidus]